MSLVGLVVLVSVIHFVGASWAEETMESRKFGERPICSMLSTEYKFTVCNKYHLIKWFYFIMLHIDIAEFSEESPICMNSPIEPKVESCWKQKFPRGIAQWIKHLPAMPAARVQTQTWPKFIVLLSSRVPPSCALSLTMPVVMCPSVNTCHGGGKKRGIMVKS